MFSASNMATSQRPGTPFVLGSYPYRSCRHGRPGAMPTTGGFRLDPWGKPGSTTTRARKRDALADTVKSGLKRKRHRKQRASPTDHRARGERGGRMGMLKRVIRAVLLVAAAAALAAAAYQLREKHQEAELAVRNIHDQLDALDPATRAAVVARLTSDEVKKAREHHQ